MDEEKGNYNDGLVNAAEIVRTFAISRQRAHELMGNYEIVWRDGSKYITKNDFEDLKTKRLQRMNALIFSDRKEPVRTSHMKLVTKALRSIGTNYNRVRNCLYCKNHELMRLIRHGEFSEEMLTKIDAVVPGGRNAFLGVVKDFKKVNTNP